MNARVLTALATIAVAGCQAAPPPAQSVTRAPFGTAAHGKAVEAFTLTNANGHVQLKNGQGYDHNWVLNKKGRLAEPTRLPFAHHQARPGIPNANGVHVWR